MASLGGLLIPLVLLIAAMQGSPAPPSSGSAAGDAVHGYGELPLAFRAGGVRGADFSSSTTAGSIALSAGGATIVPAARDAEPVRMSLLGAEAVAPIAQAKLPGVVNDLRGDDPSRWRTEIPTFARIRYPDVYPGIALDYHGTTGTLEYDFRLAPGADPSRIGIDFNGAPARLTRNGALVVGEGAGRVRQAPPVAFQPSADGRDPVESSFRLRGDHAGFALGAYDSTRPLVIDPLVLSYSTFLGGGDDDNAAAIAVDSAGAAYLTGYAVSNDFPTAGTPYDSTLAGIDAYVAKLNPTGTALVYSTLLGGSATDFGKSVAVDSSGNAYVTGQTGSTAGTPANQFPTAGGAYSTTLDNGQGDAFVTKLNATGSGLLYSARFGGYGQEEPRGIALDSSEQRLHRRVHLQPRLESGLPGLRGRLPDHFRWQPRRLRHQAGRRRPAPLLHDARRNGPGRGERHRRRFTGPRLRDRVRGSILEQQLPHDPGQPVRGGRGERDRCLPVEAVGQRIGARVLDGHRDGRERRQRRLRLRKRGGGRSDRRDRLHHRRLQDRAGPDFPLKHAYEGRSGACCFGLDLFVSKFDTTQTGADSLVYSTLISGGGEEVGGAIDVDSAGNAYVGGAIGTPGSSDRYDTTPDELGGGSGRGTAIVTKVVQSGSSNATLGFSTTIPNGGFLSDAVSGIVVDSVGDVYVAGNSTGNAPLMTTAGAFQTTHQGGDDGFISKITFSGDTDPPETSITGGPAAGSTVTSNPFTFNFSSDEANSTFECSYDGAPYASCSSPGPGTTGSDTRSLGNGNHSISVRARDAAGNADPTPSTRQFSVFIDTTPPDTSITSGPSGTVTSAAATFGFSSTEANSTFECSYDGAAFTACTAPGPGATGSDARTLANGPHTFTVRARDGAGNADASPATRTFTVNVSNPPPPDTSPPETSITKAPPGKVKSRRFPVSVRLEFSASEPGSTFACRIDSGPLQGCASPATLKLGKGKHTIAVQATDGSGNADASPATTRSR